MKNKATFHEGEREAQNLAGEAAIADRNADLITDVVIGGARPFIEKQFMVVLSSVDDTGLVWASVIFGKPGFLRTDGQSIFVEAAEQERDENDPLWRNLAVDAQLGMLFIELGTRRRYRVNGTVQSLDAERIEVAIDEAYPNCPRYIQRRHLRQLGSFHTPAQCAQGTVLRGTIKRMVEDADTIFVASRHADRGADASHRGGNPGFVVVVSDTVLRIPDFAGNSMFNTLGNIHTDGRTGICVPDFANNQILQLTGIATVLWGQDDQTNATGGTGRFIEFKLDRYVLRDIPQRMQWEYLDASPFNPEAKN